MKYNDDGEELPDDTPVELPLRFKQNPSELSRLNSVVREVIRQHVEANDDETFEDAMDLDTGEPDSDPFISKYEVDELEEESFRQVLIERRSRGKVGKDQNPSDHKEEKGDGRREGGDKSGKSKQSGKRDNPESARDVREVDDESGE